MSKPGYLNFRLDPNDLDELSRKAAAKGYSLSEMARKCLRTGMKFADDFPAKPRDHAVRARHHEAVAA
jgi:hypothetical protein